MLILPEALLQLLLVGLLTLAAVFISRVMSGVTHGIWRAGYDAERRLAIVLSALRIVLVAMTVASAIAISLPWLRTAPAHLVVLVIGAFAFASLPLLQNVVAGVYLVARGDIRECDRVRLGELVGTVREVGLGRVRIREEDGTTVLVPNRQLLRDPVAVLRASGRANVSVQLDVEEELVSHRLLRRVAVLCPYRVIGTPVHVRRLSNVYEVDMQTWRPRCQEEVERYLREALRPYRERPVPSPEASEGGAPET